MAGLSEGWKDKEDWTLKYIDDGLSREVICNTNAVVHITDKKQNTFLHARRSKKYLRLTNQNTTKIGMKINVKKTKMICVTVAKNSLVNSYINHEDGTQTYGQEELKMLGFMFGRRLNTSAHISHIRKKFYATLWVIRHLSRAGVKKDELSRIYQSYC